MRSSSFAGLLWALLLLAIGAGRASAIAITSNQSGSWNATSTWSPAQIPTASDDVTIKDGNTVRITLGNATCLSLTVGQGVSGVALFDSSTARTLTVATNLTIAAGGTLQSANSGTVTTHAISIGGNLTNNGTLDLSTAANAAGAGLTFTGAANATFSGTGATTDIRTLTLNKGTSSANTLDLSPSAFTLQGTTTDGTPSAWLTLTNGTLKISGTFAGTHRTFTSATYTIPLTGGFWLNNPNYTVAAQAGAPTLNGLLRVTQGTMNVGTTAAHVMVLGVGAVVTIEGGTTNLTGRLQTTNAISYTQSGGTLNAATVTYSNASTGAFDLSSTSNNFTMSGGTIVLPQVNTVNNSKVDYRVAASTSSITGGTLQIGSGASAAASNFQIAGLMPALVVDNTTNVKTATIFAASPASQALDVTIQNGSTLNQNAFPLTAANVTIGTGSTLNLNGTTLTTGGTSFTNNGTLTGTTAGSQLIFLNAAAAQSYSGTGTVSSPLQTITFDTPSGVTLGSGISSIPTLNVNLSRGTVTNSNKLTLGTGAALAVQTVTGKSGLVTAGGSYDVAPTFNLGTGAYTVSYQPEGGVRTTGAEIPATRAVQNLTINNANGVTLAGGDLTVNGTLTLTAGNVTTGANTLALSATGTVSRTSGFIVGNLKKNVATGANVARTFEIGTGNDFAPVNLTFASVTGAGDLTATTVAGDHPSIASSGLNASHSVNRYWTLTNAGIAFTTYSPTFNFVATDVDAGSATASFVVRKFNTPTWTTTTTGTRTATSTQATGIASFSDFAVAEAAGSHSIVASAGANGSISPSGTVAVADGASQTFTMTPAACYRVSDVLVDGSSVGAVTSFTFTNVQFDHTISVTFVNTFAITASVNGHGTISPSGVTQVVCGTDQTYTITPDPNHHITGVLVDGSPVGAVSSFTFTNVTTAHTIVASFAIDNIISVATGNWSAPATWSDGLVPTAADTVIVADGTTVTIDVAANCQRLIVGQGASGVLQYEATTARTLTVGNSVTVAAGGTFQSATSGIQTGHVLSLPGNLTNNGTLDFSTSGNTAGAGITFTGASNATFAGTGTTTDIRTLTLNKGTSAANVLDLSPGSFTVQGTTTDGTPSAWLTLTNGTLKISGTFAGTHRTFTSATYTIPATAGLWLNNPNYTVAGQNGSPVNNGLLRVTQGTMTVGTTAGNEMSWGVGATFTIEGGTLNIASRLRSPVANALTYTQTGGTVNVTTVGNATTSAGGFEVGSGTFTWSAGSIVLVQTSTATPPKRDYSVTAGTVSITGGTLQIGSGASAAASNFQIAGLMPALVVDNTTNVKTATIFAASPASQALDVTIQNGSTLNQNAFPLTAANVTIGTGSTLNLNGTTLTTGGTSFTNNGTLTGTTAGSQLIFLNGTAAQSYSGTGTVSSPLQTITFDTPSGVTLGSGISSIPTLNVNLSRGTVTNSNKLTLGTGAALAVQTVTGKSGLLTAGGSYDVAPTFNLGTGAYTVSYQPEGGARTTGAEIPATRSVQNLTINNANGVTLAGGDLTVNGTLTLTAGNVTTGVNTLALSATGTVSRTSGFIVGNLKKNVATGANVARTFEIGTGNDFAPVNLTFASVTGAGDLTATTVAGDHPSIASSGLNASHSVNRYWTLTNAGIAFTTYSPTFNFVATDVDAGSATASFVVRKFNTPTWTTTTTGTRTATSTQATGIASFSDFAVAEAAGNHSIVASAGANGSISPSGTVAVADGASQTFTMTPAACYRVSDVLVDGSSVGAVTSFTFTNVQIDHAISVTFVNTFAITASVNGHGTISPSGVTQVTCGTSQTYTITPDPNHHVTGVLVDGSPVGAVSSFTFTNVTTAHTIVASFAIDNIISVATGNWSAPGTWSDGLVPTAADTVIVADGTTVTIDVAANCQRLIVGQGTSGTLQYEATTARTLTVGNSVTVAAGGTFQSATTGAQAGHVLSLPGNLTNNGTLDFSTSGNTAGAGITFTGASNATFSGTGTTTDIRTLTLNKGTSAANVLDLSPGSFTVQGTTTDGTPSAWLTLTNGTLKISGTFSGTHRTFTSATYTIPATAGLWLNNPNYTVAGQAGSPVNNGSLRVTQGTMTVGTAAGNEMSWGVGATFTIEGGTLNIASRLRSPVANAMTYTQTGGTVNVTTVGNATGSAAGFELGSASGTFTMSGGSIVLVQANTVASNKRDYSVTAGTVSITGGTLQAGSSASAAASNFQIAGLMPALVVDNTTTTKTATLFAASPASQAPTATINTGSTLNLNGFTLTLTGTGLTNNGTLTGTVAGSTLAFVNASAAQSWLGSGAVTSPLNTLTLDSPGGLTIDSATPGFNVLNVNLFRGTLTNSNKLTLGTAGTSAAQTTIGRVGLATAAGAYDVAPTFNVGSGGYTVSYQPEQSGHTTGVEIPASRSVKAITINNANGVTLAGGGLTLTGTLTFTSGNLVTGGSVLALTSTGTVARTSGHVVGNLKKNVAIGTAVSRTFEVGTGTVYSPATIVFDNVTTAGDLTATAVAGAHPNINTSVVNSFLKVNRYWTITNSGIGFTTYSATLNFVAGDLDPGANTANFVIGRYNAPTWSATTAGTRTATSTQATGINSFSDFVIGENSHNITASAGANGTIAPPGTIQVPNGSNQTYTMTPAACYQVADVLVDGVSVGAVTSYTFTNVAAHHTIAASFVIQMHSIVASAGVHGSISPSGTVVVTCGTGQSFTITPDVDFHIADVLVDGVSVGAVTSFSFTNVTAPHTIAASFAFDNNPPVLANVPSAATIPELAAYTFTATATDVESPPEILTFSLVGAPAGASIDATSGAFAWTPSEAEGPGSYPFSVRVYDGKWNTDAPITLTVTEVNVPPILSGVPASATIPELVPYTFTATATDSDLPPQPLTFSLLSAPAGAAIDPGTGVFSWTPSEVQGPGVYAFTVRVSDGLDDVDAAISLTVDDVNSAPVVSGVPHTVSIPELAPYTFTATATDSDVPVQTLTFSLVGGPIGASIDGTTGVFTWSPTTDQTGANAFAVRVSDGMVSSDSTITITVQVTSITDLVATPVKSGNDADGTTKIALTWTTPAGHTVEIYRAGFGGYPRYDDAGGAVPATPAYPPGAPWTLVPITTSGTADEPPARDFYYYVAFAKGATSASVVSNQTPGTLNYFLGDVSDGTTAGQGDNLITMADMSLLGAHYGLEGPEAAPYAYLDVGPTTDFSTDALPTTDGIIDFEDLIVMAIGVDAVSAPAGPAHVGQSPRPVATGSPAPGAGPRPRVQPPASIAEGNTLTLESSGHAVLGDTLRCAIALRGTGVVKGLSVRLAWDASKVRPLGLEPGAVAAKAGGVVLSPHPGTVDAAFLGAPGFSGEGVVATVTFATLAAGDPGIRVVSVDARDTGNRKLILPVAVSAPVVVLPRLTQIAPAAPNPFRQSTRLAFDLAEPARVELSLFSVDGRRVRTLVNAAREPGPYSVVWDGRDDGGRPVAAGVYYVRFIAGSKRTTRPIVYLR